ncbi:MAG: DUF3160 domain-containing protein [Lachnospiraceae bacterium]|nr:DUF3160 domain-containing protein [Lachnospiraceae bacterium]
MKKQPLKKLLCLLLSFSLLCSLSACTVEINNGTGASSGKSASSAEKSQKKKEPLAEKASEGGSVTPLILRPSLVNASVFSAEDETEASVPEYTVDEDFGNIINFDDFYFEDKWKEQLLKDHFFVENDGGSEFFEVYESNRYNMVPSFVTVDSLMHSYHLYFSYLLKNLEKKELSSLLAELTDIMLTNSETQHEEILSVSSSLSNASDWKEASDRNVAYFAVAKTLLDPSYDAAKDKGVDKDTLALVKSELSLVEDASGIDVSPLAGDGITMEDYSQYKPRGYYDTADELKRYFKAMMWYGRRNFSQKSESMDRSALLLTTAVNPEARELWEKIYSVTAFFAGASDDNGICEYQPLIEEAYGKSINDISGKTVADEEAFKRYHELTAKLPAPAINSVPMWDDNGETDKAAENAGFRFMGQRFSIDEAIFQQLIYSNVMENPAGDQRLLPEALDVPAALGSGESEKLLEDLGAMEFDSYGENLNKLKEEIAASPEETWYSSLYSEWIHTLRPLLVEKGKGYPMFMQNEDWTKRSLEGFLGSYTELKHDTVLYSKQVIAEMGGGEEEEIPDYRGYVEPEPIIFKRFAELSEGTAAGLDEIGLLSKDMRKDLGRLNEIALTLKTISEKELKNETLTKDEYDFIEIYGGEIEHFWHEAYEEEANESGYGFLDSRMFPAPVVVDVATDPNGSVLELATGQPATIFVIVPVDGTLRLAKGSVFDFYQFEQPIGERMTDGEWRVKLGIDPDENGDYHWEDERPEKPSWTESYRVYWQP